MVDQLFGSKTRVKLLKLFFSNPNRSFYVREITRKVEEQINSVRRELANLLNLGLITSDSSNNKLYYEVNQKYEHYDALRSIFAGVKPKELDKKPAKIKTDTKSVKKDEPSEENKEDEQVTVVEETGYIELPEAEKWVDAGNVAGVIYSGIYTRDDNAQADILIIGDVVISKVEAVIVGLEREKNKELRYAVFDVDEWKYRREVRDKFWLQFMASKKLIVLDKNKLFEDK